MITTKSSFALMFFTLCFTGEIAWSQPVPKLLNSEFDLCEIKGIACEWVFEGAGTPVNQDGRQGIVDLPPMASATFSQVVPFCSSGGTYRLSVEITQSLSPGIMLEAGLGSPNAGKPQAILWKSAQINEPIILEAPVPGPNVIVLLRFTNQGTEPGMGFLESAAFTPVGIVSGLGSFVDDVSPEKEELAWKDLTTARNLITKGDFVNARESLQSLIDKPESEVPRSVAAEALVRMQEVAHADDYLARKQPLEMQADMTGIQYLRETLERYPDQTAACALATCKIGEFYLSRQIVPMAREILGKAIADYPGTEGAGWARCQLINAHIWSGDIDSASLVFGDLRKDYQDGNVTIQQFAWSELFFNVARITKHKNPVTEKMLEDFYEYQWKTYKDSFPEIAVRGKLENASNWSKKREYYRSINAYKEIIESQPLNDWSANARLHLASILYNYGVEDNYRHQALALINEVEKGPDIPEDIKGFAARYHQEYSSPPPLGRKQPKYNENILRNPDFEGDVTNPNDPNPWLAWQMPMFPLLPVDSTPLDSTWEKGAPSPGLGKHTPAWNSANSKITSPTLESRLVHDVEIVAGSAPFEAEAWIAVDAWDGGKVTDAAFELSVSFTDCFGRPLGTQTAGLTPRPVDNKQWRAITLPGVTPEHARFAVLSIGYRIEGNGQHAVAIAKAGLVLKEGEDE